MRPLPFVVELGYITYLSKRPSYEAYAAQPPVCPPPGPDLLLSPAAQALTPDQARELLQDYYIDEVPEDVLDQNTIQAMLEALGDPYTTYFSPEEYGAFTGSMSDTDTVGVGIYSLVTADGR